MTYKGETMTLDEATKILSGEIARGRMVTEETALEIARRHNALTDKELDLGKTLFEEREGIRAWADMEWAKIKEGADPRLDEAKETIAKAGAWASGLSFLKTGAEIPRFAPSKILCEAACRRN